MALCTTMQLMPDDDDLEDPGKTENRGWPGAGPKAGDAETFREERIREALERQRREQERRDRDDD